MGHGVSKTQEDNSNVNMPYKTISTALTVNKEFY